MPIESQILNIINDKLKNPIYQTIQLLNMQTILTKSNFSKKDGVGVHMVVLHFVYMLVIEDIVNRNEDLVSIIAVLQDYNDYTINNFLC